MNMQSGYSFADWFVRPKPTREQMNWMRRTEWKCSRDVVPVDQKQEKKMIELVKKKWEKEDVRWVLLYICRWRERERHGNHTQARIHKCMFGFRRNTITRFDIVNSGLMCALVWIRVQFSSKCKQNECKWKIFCTVFLRTFFFWFWKTEIHRHTWLKTLTTDLRFFSLNNFEIIFILIS